MRCYVMSVKRQLLLNIFLNQYSREYRNASQFDFFKHVPNDMDLVQYISEHLQNVNLDHFTPTGVKGYLTQLYIIFIDIYQSVVNEKKEKEQALKELFYQYYKHEDTNDLMNVETVLLSPEDKILERANDLLNLDDQDYCQVLKRFLEQLDHVKGQFVYDLKQLNDVNQIFLDEIASFS